MQTLFEPKPHDVSLQDLLAALFGDSDIPPALYAGEGNVHGESLGIEGLSSYRKFASHRFSDFITASFDGEKTMRPKNDADAFLYDHRKPGLFLGGPMSNAICRRALGYSLSSRVRGGEADFPIFQPENSPLRWYFDVGEGDYGLHDGKSLRAARIEPDGTVRPDRAVYGLVDRSTGRKHLPNVGMDGFLAQEWIMVVRRTDGFSPTVFIAGMHGHSLEALSLDLAVGIERVVSLAGDSRSFQLIAPVALQRLKAADGLERMRGMIEWSEAQLHWIDHPYDPSRRKRR
ncbi:MAG: hypothetical protein AAFU61_04605 [Pseudomonadota bacterium]